MNRQAYNRAKTEQRRRMREALARYKALHPNRYAELMAVALSSAPQEEQTLSSLPSASLLSQTPQEGQIRSQEAEASLLSQKIDKLSPLLQKWRAGRRDYFIHTIDPWGTEHLYFETLKPDYTIEEVEEVVKLRHPTFSGKITKVVACQCSLCRH